jgi:hypothetical protein
MIAVYAIIKESEGSRIRITKNQQVLTVHRPHPEKEAKPYQIADARTFLENLGIKP